MPRRGMQLDNVIPLLIAGRARDPLEIHLVFVDQLGLVGVGVGNKYWAGGHTSPSGGVRGPAGQVRIMRAFATIQPIAADSTAEFSPFSYQTPHFRFMTIIDFFSASWSLEPKPNQ